VPEASQGVQAWDRYAYVNNNPLKYTDPSGHTYCDFGKCYKVNPPKLPINLGSFSNFSSQNNSIPTPSSFKGSITSQSTLPPIMTVATTPTSQTNQQSSELFAGEPEYYYTTYDGIIFHIPYVGYNKDRLTDQEKLNVAIDVAGLVGEASLGVPGAEGAYGVSEVAEWANLVSNVKSLSFDQDASGLFLQLINTTTRAGSVVPPGCGTASSVGNLIFNARNGFYVGVYSWYIH